MRGGHAGKEAPGSSSDANGCGPWFLMGFRVAYGLFVLAGTIAAHPETILN